MKCILSLVLLLVGFGSSGMVVAQGLQLFNTSYIRMEGNTSIGFFYPRAVCDIKPAVADSINRYVFETMGELFPLDVKMQVTDIHTLELLLRAVENAMSGGKDPGAVPFRCTARWEALKNPKIISIFITVTLNASNDGNSTMGAFINVDTETGARIDMRNYIDQYELRCYIISQGKKYGIDFKDDILPSNLHKVPLPGQIGFTRKGVILAYAYRELLPYYRWPLVLRVPYSKFDKMVDVRFGKASLQLK